MSWFDIAKSAFSTAQKSIDKVLDIDQKDNGQGEKEPKSQTHGEATKTGVHSSQDDTDGSSFWSSFTSPKPTTHSTPKVSHTQSSSTDFVSFDEDSQWGTYFNTPQTTSLPSRKSPMRSSSAGRLTSKHVKTSPVESMHRLPSPSTSVGPSKLGPLKLGASKIKNQSSVSKAGSGPPGEPDTSSSAKVIKEIATSSGESSSVAQENFISLEKQQQPGNDNILSAGDIQVLQHVTTSELLASAEVPSSSCKDVAVVKEGQLDTPSSATQHDAEEQLVAILPTTTSEPVDSQVVSSDSSVMDNAVGLQDINNSKEKHENLNKEEVVSSSSSHLTSRLEEDIKTSQSVEISPTTEYVIVSEGTVTSNITEEVVSDVNKQSTGFVTIEAPASTSITEQKDLLHEDSDADKKQMKLVVVDDSNVEQQNIKLDNDLNTAAHMIPDSKEDTPLHSGDVTSSHVEHYEDEVQRLKSEVVRLNELLSARETKMVELSKDNINLRETEAILRNQLQQAEDNLKADQSGIEELKEEFTKRISTSEKKLQSVIKERDSLKNQVQLLQKDQKTSAEKQLAEDLAAAKEQVTGLMEEGERLSKQQLQSNNIIKKLKAKDKESEKHITSLRQQVSENEREIEKLSEALKRKDEKEKKYQESIAQLNTIAEQQAKDLTTLRVECETMTDKARGLQTNLDNAYKEMAELHKTNALSQNAAQEATLSAEITAKDQLRMVLEQHKMEARREQETLSMQLAELQMSLNRSEHQTNWKEEHFKQEIADLQQRLQEAEYRNQELTQSVSQATRPLLRQIDNLQSVHNAQTINWERVEESLSEKLVALQSQLSMAIDKERAAVEKERVMQSKLKGLEMQLANFKQAKSQLLATVEMEKAKTEAVQEELDRERAKHNSLKSSYSHTLTEARKEKEALQRQMEYEKIKAENETKKLVEEAQEKETQRLANIDNLKLSRPSSGGSNHSQGSLYDRSVLMDGYTAGLGSLTSASTVDRLQSTLKQKEGELLNVQELVALLERSRESLTNDLVNTSAQVQTLQEELSMLPTLNDNLQKLQKNYDALLQMYGEKAEEAEELKLDLLDVKTMYRSQIEELLNKQR